VFNQVSRIAIFPLVSVTTSFVAEEDATSSDRYKDVLSGQNEHSVSDNEMDELIPREGKFFWFFFEEAILFSFLKPGSYIVISI
jgi:hypothetical protein